MGSNMSQLEAYKVMLKEYPDVLSIPQVAEILNVNTKIVYRLVHSGDMLSIKVGRAFRVPKAHFIAYLKVGQLQNVV